MRSIEDNLCEHGRLVKQLENEWRVADIVLSTQSLSQLEHLELVAKPSSVRKFKAFVACLISSPHSELILVHRGKIVMGDSAYLGQWGAVLRFLRAGWRSPAIRVINIDKHS